MPSKFITQEIKLGECFTFAVSVKFKKVQVSKEGTFHPDGFEAVTITAQDHLDMVKNFDSNLRGLLDENGKPILQFDFMHEEWDKAAGWIISLEIIGQDLFALVDWSKSGKEAIEDKEFRFVSPTFFLNFDVNGENVGAFLKGAALTNVPVIKGMKAVELSGKKGGNMPEYNKVVADLSGLGDEDKKKVFDLLSPKFGKLEFSEDGQKMAIALSESKSEVIRLSETNTKLLEENKTLKDEKETSKKESQFLVLLSEHKVCPAQKEAFMLGDTVAVLAAAVPLNHEGKGSGEDGKELSEDQEDDRIIKLSDAYMKEHGVDSMTALKAVTQKKEI